MFRLNVVLTVNDADDADEIRQLLAQAAALSRAEAGCERFDVYHSQNEPTVFLLTEWWATKEHWEAHRSEKAFLEIYQPQVLPRVSRTPYFCDLVSE